MCLYILKEVGFNIFVFSTSGLAAGVHTGLTYGLKEARGIHDWVNFHYDIIFGK